MTWHERGTGLVVIALLLTGVAIGVQAQIHAWNKRRHERRVVRRFKQQRDWPQEDTA